MDTKQSFQETYFGKNKKVKHIEELFGKIRNKYKDSYMKFNIEGSSEWQELKKAFEDTFGFYSVTLILGRSGIINAYTLPVSCSLDRVYEIQSKVRLSKAEGLKFDPKDKFCTLLCIEEALLFDFDYSDAEITAIMLHEIGHNFQTVGYTHMVLLAFINSIFNVLIGLRSGDIRALALFEPIRKVALGGTNAIQTTSLYAVLDVIIKIARYPISMAIKFLYPILRVANFIQYTAIALTAPLIAYSITFDGYAGENFADKYPVMLGYGPELASGLSKMNTTINNLGTFWLINRVPLIAHMYQFLVASVTFLGIAIDPHPEYSARMMNIIKTLEDDIKDSRQLDPKAKKQIREDLAKVKKNIQTYLDNPMSYGDEVAIGYQKWLIEKFPGYGDIRSKILDDSDINTATINKNFKNLQKVKREHAETKDNAELKAMLESEEFLEEWDKPQDLIDKYYISGYTAAIKDLQEKIK